MRHRKFKTAGLGLGFFVAIGLVGCDSGTGLNLPSIIITNTWSVQGDHDRSFSFTSDDDGDERGTFTGEESVGFDTHPLAGAWAEGEVEFIVGGDRGGVVYRGTFHNLPDQLTVQSFGETIVLVRDVN